MRKTRVARTKGELRVTHADGTVEVFNEKRATDEARRAVRQRDRELKSPPTLKVERTERAPLAQGFEQRQRDPRAMQVSDAIEAVRNEQRERYKRT